jgi:hypothetical protein
VKKVVIRPVDDPSLEEGIGKLRILAFPYFPEVRDLDFYSFVYHRWWERHPLAGELRRWVAVTGEGEVVGHLSGLPQYYRLNGRRVIAHTPADYMAHPKHGFQALALMRTFFRACENCVACDMVPATIAIETRLGAEEAGELSYALKLLDVSRIPALPAPTPVRRLLNLPERNSSAPVQGYPGQASGSEGAETTQGPPGREPPAVRERQQLPAPVKGLLNGGLRAIDRGLARAFGGGLRVEELDGFDEYFDGFFERVAAAVACVPEKDTAFLRWRYGPGSPLGWRYGPDSPQWPVTILGVRGGEGLLGYAVLYITADMDGYVLDLTALPGRQDVTRALILKAVGFFRKAGAHVIRYRYQDSPTSPRPGDLKRLAFFYRKSRRNTLLVKFSDTGLHEAAHDLANWSYTIGDGEASFWLR